MSFGVLIVVVWFLAVAAYLVWQYATSALAAPAAEEIAPAPTTVAARESAPVLVVAPVTLRPAPVVVRS